MTPPPPGRFVELGDFAPPGLPSRPVRLYVPTGVDASRPHPTLYLFDGQNVFDDAGSFAGGWHAHEAVEKLGARTMARPVVVGIGNGGRARIRELGKAPEAFLDALIRDVVPRVESTVHGGGGRTLGGSSLGGLAALCGWLSRPEVFADALVMSPSLWFDRGRLLRSLIVGDCPLPPGRIYLDAGGRERGRMLHDAALLASWLTTQGLGPDRLKWRADPRGGHNEAAWRRRLPPALRFLFRRGVRVGRGPR